MSQDSPLLFEPYPSPPRCISQVVMMLLRSPFHTLMSHQTMILTLYGKKTGKSYTLPVTYLQEGHTVFLLTRSNWWKNLRNGATVMLYLRGHSVSGVAHPVFDQLLIAQKIAQIVQMDYKEAKYFSIKLDNHNQPDPTSLTLAAQQFILIRIQLPSS